MKPKPISAADTLHRLMFQALLEIRSQGHEAGNKVVFRLADLFHTIVLEMERAARGESSYDEVLRLLQQLAAEKGCEKWLAQQLGQLATASAPMPDAVTDGTGDSIRLTEPA